MGHNQPIRKASPATPSDIPDKLYFRIGDVARLCQVPAYVLRFWESEFPQLKPNKGGTGQRLYRRRDVEMALRVKTLLYDEGYTIPGARAILKSEFRQKEPPQLALPGTPLPTTDTTHLRTIRRELEAIAALLARPASTLTTPATPARPASTLTIGARPASIKAPIHPIRAPRRPTEISNSLFDPPETPIGTPE